MSSSLRQLALQCRLGDAGSFRGASRGWRVCSSVLAFARLRLPILTCLSTSGFTFYPVCAGGILDSRAAMLDSGARATPPKSATVFDIARKDITVVSSPQ
jgi:hypothetical protein